MSNKKHLKFLELLYKKKEKTLIDFLIDEIDDSYFFHNSLFVLLYKLQLSGLKKVSLEKFTQSKKSLWYQVWGIKALTLRLNYTSKGKKFYLF